MNESNFETIENPSKNPPYEELEKMIPEMAAMKGLDQKSDFHALTLDEHTKEMGAHLEKDEFLMSLPQEARDLIELAGKLHDLGKTSSDGAQVNPKDPEKRQYIGHEQQSEKMIREILPKHINLSEVELDFVAKLAGMHASALNLVNNFEKNNQPKGKDLGAYDNFLKRVEALPCNLSANDKMKIVFALNKADKLAGYNEQSDRNSEKVKKIIENAQKQITTLVEMEKSLPALIEAIDAKRNGDQKAGIVFESGGYKYNKALE